MSTLSVDAILDASGGTTASINGYTPTASNMAGKNRVINGDMRIDQRNAGAAVTANNAYPVDRFIVDFSTDGAFSAQQDSSAPAGFVNSIKFTTTTADASLGATQYFYVRQKIEGTNVADLAWGTANAKTVTLSFWVRSSLTGTFGGSFWNSSFNRSYPFTYTISSANTWERKTITVAGDTTGTWLTTNGVGINVGFGLGLGSTYSGTAGSWTASGLISATGAVSVIGTLNATWYVTGVQLEVGSSATEFEHRQYGQELALCQRYYWNPNLNSSQYYWAHPLANGLSYLRTNIQFPVEMRATPTGTISGVNTGAWGSGLPNFVAYGKTVGQANMDATTSGHYSYVNSLTLSAEL